MPSDRGNGIGRPPGRRPIPAPRACRSRRTWACRIWNISPAGTWGPFLVTLGAEWGFGLAHDYIERGSNRDHFLHLRGGRRRELELPSRCSSRLFLAAKSEPSRSVAASP